MEPSYIDSFGSPIQQTSAVSFDGKKKKRNIIIGMVVAIVVVLAVVLIAIFGSGGFKTGFSNKEKYLNYLVNGDTNNSENVGTEYSDARNYYFTDAVYLDEIGVSYFDELIKLLDNVNVDKNDINYLEQKAMLEMFRNYKALSEITLDDIVNNTGEELVESVENLSDSMNAFLKTYKSNAVPYIEGLLKIVSIGKSIGCNVDIPEAECAVTNEMQEISNNNMLLLNNIEKDINMAVSYYLNLAYALGVRNE